MAILLPQQFFNLAAGVGKSYYEDLTGGKNASVTVQNNSTFAVELVLTRVNAPVISYAIPAGNSLTIVAHGLLVAALLANGGGATFGFIQVATADI